MMWLLSSLMFVFVWISNSSTTHFCALFVHVCSSWYFIRKILHFCLMLLVTHGSCLVQIRFIYTYNRIHIVLHIHRVHPRRIYVWRSIKHVCHHSTRRWRIACSWSTFQDLHKHRRCHQGLLEDADRLKEQPSWAKNAPYLYDFHSKTVIGLLDTETVQEDSQTWHQQYRTDLQNAHSSYELQKQSLYHQYKNNIKNRIRLTERSS